MQRVYVKDRPQTSHSQNPKNINYDEVQPYVPGQPSYNDRTTCVVEHKSTPKLPVIQQHTGTIKKFDPNKHYGFINCDRTNKSIFFHMTNLLNGIIPHEGDRVIFTIEESDRGLRANNIRIK